MRRFDLALVVLYASWLFASDWPQFRGPNARGVSETTGLPVEFGPSKNVIWKTALPPGHSSPVLTADRIFLTAFDAEHLYVITLDRSTGKILWRREVPRPRKQKLHESNSPASPSVATDGRNVYAFFTDFGLISYGSDGEERWRVPLGPFNNPFGLGASPVLANGKVIQVCDSESGSFAVAVDQKTGRLVWRVERPDMTRGFATPVLYQPEAGGLEALVAGTNRLIAYDVDTGKQVWWVRGLTWQLKPTPVIDGRVVYVLGWAGGADQGNQQTVPSFREMLAAADRNHDGKLAKAELTDPQYQKDFDEADFDGDGFLEEREWEKLRERHSVVNSVMAVKLGGSGDMTETNILWRHYRSLPNVPSPLVYHGVLYLMKEGGILTALDASTGKVLKQGRLKGALDFYYSSPVGADGKIFTASQEGHVSVIRAGADWEVLAVNDMDDEVFATPAPVDQRLYLRTRSALYCFGIAPRQN
ncbi:MAG TPA: PQQ-binding-like beta-propeller repeat protein [Bryobacteraceae bacterium]|nr:PQQ-binding-like beta-propeller repeat protein [Bryobacteraceae bacterium]